MALFIFTVFPAAIGEMGKGTGLSEEPLRSRTCVVLQPLAAQPASAVIMVSGLNWRSKEATEPKVIPRAGGSERLLERDLDQAGRRGHKRGS